MIGPNLTEPQAHALQRLNITKPEDRNMLENHLGKKLNELDFHVKVGNENLRKIENQRKTLEEALQRASGAYEGFASVLAVHYSEQDAEQPTEPPTETPTAPVIPLKPAPKAVKPDAPQDKEEPPEPEDQPEESDEKTEDTESEDGAELEKTARHTEPAE